METKASRNVDDINLLNFHFLLFTYANLSRCVHIGTRKRIRFASDPDSLRSH